MTYVIRPLFLIVLCTMFTSLQLSAQQVEVSGQVKDSETRENLPYCKVVALNSKDSIVQGGITDEGGFFRLPLAPGQYKLVISSYDYENDTIQTGYFREDIFLGVFKLKSSFST